MKRCSIGRWSRWRRLRASYLIRWLQMHRRAIVTLKRPRQARVPRNGFTPRLRMSNSWPGLFGFPQFLEPSLVDAIVAEMKSATGSAATVYGSTVSGSVDESVRRTFRVKPSSETVALVTQKLLVLKDAVEKRFQLALKECEEPQFLRYREGDFFVAHQDGNTG